jgi:hypothetical protein
LGLIISFLYEARALPYNYKLGLVRQLKNDAELKNIDLLFIPPPNLGVSKSSTKADLWYHQAATYDGS